MFASAPIENTSGSALLKGGVAMFIVEYIDILIQLRWMLFLALVLIIADLWFGLKDSIQHHVPIRKSRAIRRTINKMIDYFVYILLGTSLAMAIGEPYGLDPKIVSISVLLLCYLLEIDSIYDHICELHNIKKKISIWKVVRAIFIRNNKLNEIIEIEELEKVETPEED